MPKTTAQLTLEIRAARAAQDWGLVSELTDQRRCAEVDADEAAAVADEAAAVAEFQIVATDKNTGRRVYGRRTLSCELAFRTGPAISRTQGDTEGLHLYPHRGTNLTLEEAGALLVRINSNLTDRHWIKDVHIIQSVPAPGPVVEDEETLDV